MISCIHNNSLFIHYDFNPVIVGIIEAGRWKSEVETH
jgi:hypothetical protein